MADADVTHGPNIRCQSIMPHCDDSGNFHSDDVQGTQYSRTAEEGLVKKRLKSLRALDRLRSLKAASQSKTKNALHDGSKSSVSPVSTEDQHRKPDNLTAANLTGADDAPDCFHDVDPNELEKQLKVSVDLLRTLREWSLKVVEAKDQEIFEIFKCSGHLTKQWSESISQNAVIRKKKTSAMCPHNVTAELCSRCNMNNWESSAQENLEFRNLLKWTSLKSAGAEHVQSRRVSIVSDTDTSSYKRVRRRSETLDPVKLPDPGIGFKRLLGMDSTASLGNVASLSIQGKSFNATLDGESRKLKYPLNAVRGQCTIVETKGISGRGASRMRSRAGSEEAVASVQNLFMDNQTSKFASFKNGRRPEQAKKQNQFSQLLATVRTVLSQTFCLKNLVDERKLTIGPYLRFVWILALGFMDFFLVLVLLFWPEKDFMCKTNGSSAVIEESDIIGTIGAILVLHTGDVLSRMRTRDATERFIGFSIFSPEAVGGIGLAMYNVWDVFIITLSAVIAWLNNYYCTSYYARDADSYPYRIVKRLHIIVNTVRCIVGIEKCFRLGRHLRRRLQRAVSMNKRRFIDDECRFDLDLTYICDRLIVMAIPVIDGALYRNDIREDFETNGNGCYDTMLLFDQIQKLPFRDHNAPYLHVLVAFCKQATAWLNENSANVVAIHCQGGKGRSGTFASSLMLWCGFGNSADDVLESYAQRRTDPRKVGCSVQGVAAPSQIRYLRYIEMIAKGHDYAIPVRFLLSSVTLHTMPLHKKQKIAVAFIVECSNTIQYDHGKRHGMSILVQGISEQDQYTFDTDDILVSGDVAIRFYVFEETVNGPLPNSTVGPGGRTIKYGNIVGKQLCFVTFHTSFHHPGTLKFSKSEIDGVYDKPVTDFLDDFCLSVVLHSSSTALLSPKLKVNTFLRSTAGSFVPSVIGTGRRNSSSVVQKPWDSVPYGIVKGHRLVHLHHAVDSIFSTICPRVLEYRRGDLLYRSEDSWDRCLYQIVGGVAEYGLSNDEEQKQSQWRINRGDSMSGLTIGAGEFFGELKFLLGVDGDPCSFALRASSEIVQVRVLRIGNDYNASHGVIEANSKVLSPQQMSIIFELLAKTLSAKTRELSVLVARQSIMAQIIQKVVKDLQLGPNCQYIKMAEATIFSKNGNQANGSLLLFSNQLIFFSNNTLFTRGVHIQLYYQSIPQVASFGEKLSVTLNVDQESEQEDGPISRVDSVLERSSSASKASRSNQSSLRNVKSNSAWGSPHSKRLVKKWARQVTAYATTATGSSNICLHFRLADSNVCTDIKNTITEKVAELSMASRKFQKDIYHHSVLFRGNEFLFGYMLPTEKVSEEEKDAVNQIFVQAKKCSYKAGEAILQKGSTTQNLYHILCGSAVVRSATGQFIIRLSPGEIFGEVSFVDQGDVGAGATVEAEEDVDCLVVVHDSIEMLATLQPLLGVRFWRCLTIASAFRMRHELYGIETRRKEAITSCR